MQSRVLPPSKGAPTERPLQVSPVVARPIWLRAVYRLAGSREPSTKRPACTRPPRSLAPHAALRHTAWSPSRFPLLSVGLRNPIGHQLQRGSLPHDLVLIVDLPQL